VLSSIIKLLTERETLSVQDISLSLGIESSALRPMLDLLERKGKVEKMELPCKKKCAGGCTQSDAMTFYKRVT
jgi:predicted ArsR family transcriptional regulator